MTILDGLRRCLVPLGLILVSGPARGAGEEAKGNDPVVQQPDWKPGIVDVANLKSRVFRQWVNGNEDFYYRGDAAALNEALEAFAAVKDPVLEVVLLPDPGRARTFQGEDVPFDWSLHVPSGIYLRTVAGAIAPDGTEVIGSHARMYVYLGGDGQVDLDRIKVPEGLLTLDRDDLKDRLLKGLKVGPDPPEGQAKAAGGSLSNVARGLAAQRLGAFLIDDPEVIDALARMADDPDRYARLSALGALRSLGAAAKPALPTLRDALDDADEETALALRETIDAIQAAEADLDAENRRRTLIERIHPLRHDHLR